MQQLSLTLLVLAQFVLLACHDGQECTLAGCPSGIELSFDAPIAIESDGYQASVVADGVSSTCTLFKSSDRSRCESGLSLSYSPGGDLIGLRIHGAPTRIALIVSSPAGVVAQGELAPITYVESYPNGPECDERPCKSAKVTFHTGS